MIFGRKDRAGPAARTDRVRLPLQVAPWLAIVAMAAFWPRRKPVEAAAAPLCITPLDFDRAEPGRGRDAAAPWLIPPLGWKDIIWRTWREAGRDRLSAVAGGITFYLLLATFPALAAFVSVYGLFLDVEAWSAVCGNSRRCCQARWLT